MRDKLVEQIQIAAPPEKVFEGWTSKILLTRWWRNTEFHTVHWEGSVRTGGHWLVQFEDPQGNVFSASGEYLHARPPLDLSFTWKPDWDGEPPTVIELEIQPSGEGSLLKLSQYGFANPDSYERNRQAWAATLAMLRVFLEEPDRQSPV